MQEFNVVSLITKFSADVVIGAVVACVCTFLLKSFFNRSTKFYMLLSFVFAMAITALINFFALKEEIVESLYGGITAGALAMILTVFIKKFAFSDDDDLKSDLEKLLSGIILSGNLEEVVDDIIKKITDSKAPERAEVKKILKDVLENDTDEKTLDALTDFICDVLNIGDSEE